MDFNIREKFNPSASDNSGKMILKALEWTEMFINEAPEFSYVEYNKNEIYMFCCWILLDHSNWGGRRLNNKFYESIFQAVRNTGKYNQSDWEQFKFRVDQYKFEIRGLLDCDYPNTPMYFTEVLKARFTNVLDYGKAHRFFDDGDMIFTDYIGKFWNKVNRELIDKKTKYSLEDAAVVNTEDMSKKATIAYALLKETKVLGNKGGTKRTEKERFFIFNVGIYYFYKFFKEYADYSPQNSTIELHENGSKNGAKGKVSLDAYFDNGFRYAQFLISTFSEYYQREFEGYFIGDELVFNPDLCLEIEDYLSKADLNWFVETYYGDFICLPKPARVTEPQEKARKEKERKEKELALEQARKEKERQDRLREQEDIAAEIIRGQREAEIEMERRVEEMRKRLEAKNNSGCASVVILFIVTAVTLAMIF